MCLCLAPTYVQAKLAAHIKSQLSRRRNAFDELDDDDDEAVVDGGAQEKEETGGGDDDDDHEDEDVQVVEEPHEVGLEEDDDDYKGGAHDAIDDASPSKNPFDVLSDEEGEGQNSPPGSAKPNPSDKATVRSCL